MIKCWDPFVITMGPKVNKFLLRKPPDALTAKGLSASVIITDRAATQPFKRYASLPFFSIFPWRPMTLYISQSLPRKKLFYTPAPIHAYTCARLPSQVIRGWSAFVESSTISRWRYHRWAMYRERLKRREWYWLVINCDIWVRWRGVLSSICTWSQGLSRVTCGNHYSLEHSAS